MSTRHTPDLPDTWTTCTIGDITLPVDKVDPADDADREIIYIDISSIDNVRNRITQTKRYKLGDAPSRARQIVKKGDVLFSSVRPYLRNIALVHSDSDNQIASTGFAVLRPADGIHSAFLFYKAISQSFVDAVSALQYGVSYPAVKDTQVRAQLTELPPQNEQLRIVEKIETLTSELDKGVENLNRAKKQLVAYRQAVLKHAFEGKLTAQWREDNKEKLTTREELIANIKTQRENHYLQQIEDWKHAVTNWEAQGKYGKKPAKPQKPDFKRLPTKDELKQLPDLPFGWTWVRLENLCEVVRGGSPRPAGDKRYYEGSIPFLKVADITRTAGAYLKSFSHTIKEAGLDKTRRVGPKTLLISNSGASLGIPKICMIDATFNDGIAAFLGLPAEQLLYHYYFWSSKTLELRGINQGAAQPNLNTGLLGDTFIPISSPDEMQTVANLIENKLSHRDQVFSELEENLDKCRALRQLILEKAFSGQLVDQDPNDEPATTLLERIKAEKQEREKNNKGRKKEAVA